MWRAIDTLIAKVRAVARGGRSRDFGKTPRENAAPSVARVVVLGLLGSDQERRVLAGLGSDQGWEIQFSDTCTDALAACDAHKVPVILCDRDLPSSDWRHVIQTLASSSRPACVILLSRIVDDSLWEEVIRCGGYDILAKPLSRNEVLRVVKLARSFWDGMMKMPAYSTKRLSSR